MQNTRTRRGSSFQERDSNRYNNDFSGRDSDRFRDYDDYNARSHQAGHTGRRDDYEDYNHGRGREGYNRNRDNDYGNRSAQGNAYGQGFYGDTHGAAGTNDWDRDQYSGNNRGGMRGQYGNNEDRWRGGQGNSGRSWDRDNDRRSWNQQNNGGRSNERNWGDNRSWNENRDMDNRSSDRSRRYGGRSWDQENFGRSWDQDQQNTQRGTSGYDPGRYRGEQSRQEYNAGGDTFNDRGDWDDNEHQRHGRVSGLGYERRRRSFSNVTGNNAQGTPGTWGSGRYWR